ncbi:hypothetical protein LRS06_02665 [Hymenobacter sp. J193]|uniref:hypothetical protein n=1 Tax=Hymenobacter sp. J193 TaxID=2898429 RepID=UPI002151523E|nr:hypothetical protein [Hymenobacter sp. J193]MCR5886694.1 hypothetical protein [Hymenobacter sp. J193]
MLRLITSNGRLEIENEALETKLLETQLQRQADAEAEQKALMVLYRIEGEPDPSLPYDGLLTKRLQVGVSTARLLITEGKIAYICAAKKAYRVSEKAVRYFLGDLEQREQHSIYSIQQ